MMSLRIGQRNGQRNGFLILLAVVLVLTALCSLRAEARRGGHWYGPGFNAVIWQQGYWYHGAYLDREGWWWVAGPEWFLYANPVYPYPAPDLAPVYFVRMQAPPPGAVVVAPSHSQTGAPNAESSQPPQPTETATPPAVQSPLPTNPGTPPQGYFYFCAKSNAYYPTVATCEQAWVAIPVGEPFMTRRWGPMEPLATSAEAVVARPSAATLELGGRALAYSFSYDRAISDHLSLGIGLSSWTTRNWWTGYNETVTVIPIYADYYFTEEPGRGYFTLGFDGISVTNQSGPGDANVFDNNGVAVTLGAGYEFRHNSGFILRVGGVMIMGGSFTLSPFAAVGYTF